MRVVNANMERALRVVSIERGYDPRDFALVAFGGAGGLHACELAEALAIPTVIIPANPGALSAIGILESDVVKDFSRTVLWRVASQLPRAELEKEFRKLEAAAQKEFREEKWNGKPHHERSLDVRYRGQGYELNIPIVTNSRTEPVARFHDEHRRRYGYHHAGREIEIVTLRLRSKIKARALGITQSKKSETRKSRALPVERAGVIFDGKTLATPVYERGHLVPGQSLRGPAIITEYSATTVIPPGKKFHMERNGNLLIAIK